LSSRWLGDEGFFQPTGSAGMLGEQQKRPARLMGRLASGLESLRTTWSKSIHFGFTNTKTSNK